MMNLYRLIKYHPKCASLFEAIKLQMSPYTSDLKPICPTRWIVISGVIAPVLQNYVTLTATSEEVNESGCDEYAVKAEGFAKQLQMFSNFFGLKLCPIIITPTEQLSWTLHGKDTIVQEDRAAANVSEMSLHEQGNDDSYGRFYDSVVAESSDMTDEPTLPKIHKVPWQFCDGPTNHQH